MLCRRIQSAIWYFFDIAIFVDILAGVTRWFEISSITQAFHIKKVPLDQSYLSGFGDYFQLVDSLSQYSVASDDFAHIFISRDDASMFILCSVYKYQAQRVAEYLVKLK